MNLFMLKMILLLTLIVSLLLNAHAVRVKHQGLHYASLGLWLITLGLFASMWLLLVSRQETSYGLS